MKSKTNKIIIKGARQHNLKDLNIEMLVSLLINLLIKKSIKGKDPPRTINNCILEETANKNVKTKSK